MKTKILYLIIALFAYMSFTDAQTPFRVRNSTECNYQCTLQITDGNGNYQTLGPQTCPSGGSTTFYIPSGWYFSNLRVYDYLGNGWDANVSPGTTIDDVGDCEYPPQQNADTVEYLGNNVASIYEL
jgi:hypothetical protein